MKSSFLVIAALLMLSSPAMAFSVDHSSGFADASGGSRFNDPDEQEGNSPFGMVQLGGGDSSSSGSSSGPSFSFGLSGSNDGGQLTQQTPGYAMQGCLSAVCQH